MPTEKRAIFLWLNERDTSGSFHMTTEFNKATQFVKYFKENSYPCQPSLREELN